MHSQFENESAILGLIVALWNETLYQKRGYRAAIIQNGCGGQFHVFTLMICKWQWCPLPARSNATPPGETTCVYGTISFTHSLGITCCFPGLQDHDCLSEAPPLEKLFPS